MGYKPHRALSRARQASEAAYNQYAYADDHQYPKNLAKWIQTGLSLDLLGQHSLLDGLFRGISKLIKP